LSASPSFLFVERGPRSWTMFSPVQNCVEEKSGTRLQNLTDKAPPSVSRATLRRVNTPPGLNLFNLISSADASALAAPSFQHRRSHSAVGQTVATEPAMNGSVSAGLTMRPGTSASAMTALQIGMDSMRSPCFVHKTFGPSINLERVLDECRAEEMTHHNLLQTATGVREVARQLGIGLFLKFAQYRPYYR